MAEQKYDLLTEEELKELMEQAEEETASEPSEFDEGQEAEAQDIEQAEEENLPPEYSDEAEAEAVEQELEEEAEKVFKKKKGGKKVPLKAVQAERKKRQFYQQQVEMLKKQNEELLQKLQALSQVGTPQPQGQPQMPSYPQGSQDPIKELIQPYVQPEVQRLKEEIQAILIDNQDKMDFMLKHPDLDPKVFEQVEQFRIQLWRQKGYALSREDAYYLWLGLTQKQRNQLKKQMESESKAKQKAMNQSAKVGTSTVKSSPAVPKSPEELSDEELEQILSDKTF